MTKISLCLNIQLAIILIIASNCNTVVRAETCSNGKFVYGRNEIIDQIIICSLAKANDLDLTPQRGHVKLTSRAFVELGFSNMTDIVSAKLSGLWTAKRPEYSKTTWQCTDDAIIASTIVEINGLALDVIERVDISMGGKKGPKQTSNSQYKPCKTFNLPKSLCRQTKTIYKNTRTWVNRAFFNLTLIQDRKQTGFSSPKPSIQDLWLMFTCPETFRHKITYSPSASYVLTKHTQDSISDIPISARSHSKKRTLEEEQLTENHVPIPHPILQASIQDGRGPVAPPYQKSVNTILGKTMNALAKTIGECLDRIDSDLSIIADHVSFDDTKYEDDANFKIQRREMNTQISRCSSKIYLKQRTELAISGHSTQLSSNSPSSMKRTLNQASVHGSDPDNFELLDPYEYYHDKKINMMVTNDGKLLNNHI